MKIGIIGAGSIGTTLAQRLSAAGHDVAIANSRGPETIDPAALSTGARAVHADDVTESADVVIVSVAISRVPDVAPLVRNTPAAAVIIDTSNYYPLRDGHIPALDDGQVESLWVAEHYGRTLVKAWNAITAQSFSEHATAAGTADRIAIAVAGDDEQAKQVAASLVEETGFDAFDTGSLADSWRQQPGTPAYCTDRTGDELPESLAKADAGRSARRRDLAIAAAIERTEAEGPVSSDYLVRLNRAIY
jgi:predicted dinucleotide-binding enzyme